MLVVTVQWCRVFVEMPWLFCKKHCSTSMVVSYWIFFIFINIRSFLSSGYKLTKKMFVLIWIIIKYYIKYFHLMWSSVNLMNQRWVTVCLQYICLLQQNLFTETGKCDKSNYPSLRSYWYWWQIQIWKGVQNEFIHDFSKVYLNRYENY